MFCETIERAFINFSKNMGYVTDNVKIPESLECVDLSGSFAKSGGYYSFAVDIVRTYGDYLKHSLIEKIIIYDKENCLGYVKFKGDPEYIYLCESEQIGQKSDGKTDLIKWLQTNSEFGVVPYCEPIINEIIGVCFCDKINMFKPKRNEYLLMVDNEMLVFDSETITFKIPPHNHIITNLCKCPCSTRIRSIKDIDIKFIKEMLLSYIKPDKFSEFSKLFRGIITGNGIQNTYIENSYDKGVYKLTQFVFWCKRTLAQRERSIVSQYYTRQKIVKGNRIDFLFVDESGKPEPETEGSVGFKPIINHEINKIIEKAHKSGINNVIFKHQGLGSSYNNNGLREFIVKNMGKMTQYISVRSTRCCEWNKYLPQIVDELTNITVDEYCGRIGDLFERDLFIDIVCCLLSN